jgi:uncharacterized protein (DUF58 family)
MSTKRRTTIRLEGWYYLIVLGFILGGAMLREINLLMLLAGMMIGPLLVNWRVAVASLRGVTAKRHLPEAVCAGDLLVVELQLSNTRRRWGSWAVAIQDTARRIEPNQNNEKSRASVLVAHLAAGETVRTSYRGRLMQRGRYRFGPLRVSTGFPLGFIRRVVSFRDDEEILVYPRIGQLTPEFLGLEHQERHWGPHARANRTAAEGDFYGLRDWRPGDSRRWIHWRTTARSGNLVVRQFEEQNRRNVAIVLDLTPAADDSSDSSEHDRGTFEERVEMAIRFAATILSQRCREGGGEVMLAIAGRDPVRTSGPASPGMLQEILEHLATAQPPSEDQLEGVLEGVFEEIPPGQGILMISTRPRDQQADREWSSQQGPVVEAALEQLTHVDVGSEQFADYFHDA